MVEVGIFKEGFGGNAAPVEAGSAGALHFNTGHFFPKLTGTDGRDISAGATTDNDKIVRHEVTVPSRTEKSRANQFEINTASQSRRAWDVKTTEAMRSVQETKRNLPRGYSCSSFSINALTQ
jgi:hypothetical protein